MAKRFRPQNIPPDTAKIAQYGELPEAREEILVSSNLYGQRVETRAVLKKNGRRHLSGHERKRAIPVELIPIAKEHARKYGYPLHVQRTKHGERVSVSFPADSPEQAEADYKGYIRRLRNLKWGLPEVTLKAGINYPEPSKQEIRRKRKQRERDEREGVFLARLRDWCKNASIPAIEERLAHQEKYAPEEYRAKRMGILYSALQVKVLG